MICRHEELVVWQEAAGDERIVDAVDRLRASIEIEHLVNSNVADDVASHIFLPRDDFNGKEPIILISERYHVSLVGLDDLAHLEELATNGQFPLLLLIDETKASDNELVLIVFKRLIATDGDCGLCVVSDNYLDDGISLACREVIALCQVVEYVFVAHQVIVAFVKGIKAVGGGLFRAFLFLGLGPTVVVDSIVWSLF